MRGRDDEGARADEVADVAEDAGALGRVVDDAAPVLQVLGVAEEDGAGDLCADRRGDVADRGGGEGGPLAVCVCVPSALSPYSYLEKKDGGQNAEGQVQEEGIGAELGDLPVAAGDDLGAGALAVGELEEALHLANGGAARAIGQRVVAEGSGVGAADALDPDAGAAVLTLEGRGDGGSQRALVLSARERVLGPSCALPTRLPLSVEPRA